MTPDFIFLLLVPFGVVYILAEIADFIVTIVGLFDD